MSKLFRPEFFPHMRRCVVLAAGFAMLLTTAVGGQTSLPCLGAVSRPQGFSWTYSGTRHWSTGGDRQDSERFTWTTTVVDARSFADASLAVVEGFVTELAWSTPASKPEVSALVCSAGHLFHFDVPDDARRFAIDPADVSLLKARPLLETPLRSGQIFGQDGQRTDDMYGWTVETIRSSPNVPRSCGAARGPAYRLTYRTLPDHQILEWRPEIGVTRYVYEHHGTVASVDVRLASCRTVR